MVELIERQFASQVPGVADGDGCGGIADDVLHQERVAVECRLAGQWSIAERGGEDGPLYGADGLVGTGDQPEPLLAEPAGDGSCGLLLRPGTRTIPPLSRLPVTHQATR